ncbi:hypothetical protein HP547_28735 [Pseudomonas sp. CrR7]|nr:hypothetical protein [Pseudomonas sp. CM27]
MPEFNAAYRFEYTVPKSIQAHSNAPAQGFDPQTLFTCCPCVAFSFQKNHETNMGNTYLIVLYGFSKIGRVLASRLSTQERGATAPNALLPEDSP